MRFLESSRLRAEADLPNSCALSYHVVMVHRDFQRRTKQLFFRDAEQQSFVENSENVSDVLQTRFPFMKFLTLMEECCFCV